MSAKNNETLFPTGIHVLLVEDTPSIQMIHSKKLESLGCTFDLAKDGKEALEKMKNKYDLILMDLGLPDMDGIEVCRHIRQYEEENKLPRVPIAMITASPETLETKQGYKEVGIDIVLAKPVVEDRVWCQLIARKFDFL